MNKNQLLEELRSHKFPELIIKAFEKVKREKFIPREFRDYAYMNEPLPLEKGATISQPYTIAFMLNLLELDGLTYKNKLINGMDRYEKSSKREIFKHSKSQKFEVTDIRRVASREPRFPGLKILEIGSGSGYVLALINDILKLRKIKDYKIYGLEIINELVKNSKKILRNKKIKIIKTDGSKGLKSKSPFDRIIASASFGEIPSSLFAQLKERGILVTPVRDSIYKFKKINGRVETEEFPGFVFVPVV